MNRREMIKRALGSLISAPSAVAALSQCAVAAEPEQPKFFYPKIIRDVSLLRTYRMDIRQILCDNMIRDMIAEKEAEVFASLAS